MASTVDIAKQHFNALSAHDLIRHNDAYVDSGDIARQRAASAPL